MEESDKSSCAASFSVVIERRDSQKPWNGFFSNLGRSLTGALKFPGSGYSNDVSAYSKKMIYD